MPPNADIAQTASPITVRPGVASDPGWLMGARFDLGFIVGIAALALGSGIAVVIEPALFAPILFADLWLLGYHHVVSTYTRLCFDRQSFREHRMLLFGLPVVIFFAVLMIGGGLGIWALVTIYFYWQWFHYTRQSYGVAQFYARKAGETAPDSKNLTLAIIYLVPLWGILHRSHQGWTDFLGIPIVMAPVPGIVVDIAGVVAAIAVGAWLVNKVQQWRAGTLPVAHTLFVTSHLLIFAVGYVLIPSLVFGWLVINIWHNAQYIAFVWLYNNRRFEGKSDASARFLSWISQRKRAWAYLGLCVAISTGAYLSIDGLFGGLGLVIVIYQAINFHHYIVDSLIWKARKPTMQKTMGIQ